MSYLAVTDFTGFYSIDISEYIRTDMEAVIAATEAQILRNLLGETLYLDLTTNPTATRWTDFTTNGKTYTDYTGMPMVWTADNFKEMLKGFCFYEIWKAKKDMPAGTTFATQKNENSDVYTHLHLLNTVFERYNKAVDIYNGRAWNFLYSLKSVAPYPYWYFIKKTYKKVT